jgi:DNA-binding transcriptional regulator YiaG
MTNDQGKKMRTKTRAKTPTAATGRRGRPAKAPDPTRIAAQLGAAIRAARILASLSVETAARRLGVPATRWYDWESGRACLPLLQIRPLCIDLGCTFSDIIPAAD